MAISLAGRTLARRRAAFHVQLEFTRVPVNCPNREVDIEGRVVRVFRAQALLRPGDPISFSIWVVARGGEPTGPAFVYHDALLASVHMEAYLNGTPPRCRLAAYEFDLLQAPTDVPTMSDDDLERLRSDTISRSAPNLRRARWWQIWKR